MITNQGAGKNQAPHRNMGSGQNGHLSVLTGGHFFVRITVGPFWTLDEASAAAKRIVLEGEFYMIESRWHTCATLRAHRGPEVTYARACILGR
jgi:hypothetical protein